MEVKTLSILEKSQPQQDRGFHNFWGPLGDKREYFWVSVRTNKHSHHSHCVFSCFFPEMVGVGGFRFFERRETEKEPIRLQSERNKRKVIGGASPFPF